MFNFDVVMTPTDSPRPELIAAQPAKYKNVEKDHIFFECSFWDRLTLSVNHFIFISSVLLDLSMGVLVFSVAKATLHSQMSVCSSVCKTPKTAKNQWFTTILIAMLTTILTTIPTSILTIILQPSPSSPHLWVKSQKSYVFGSSLRSPMSYFYCLMS